MVKITECPRDAMQGIHDFIATEDKISYINQLLEVGFDTIDFGSFVSPKAIPQLRDTTEVLSKLKLSNTKSKLLAIVANKRGAEEACNFNEINYLGYPFSISETFQKRNTNSTIEQSLNLVEEIQNLCLKNHKHMVVYLSMAFGNPYGDTWHPDIAIKWSLELQKKGVKIIALADTTGVSNPESIRHLFSQLIPEIRIAELGAHLHSNKEDTVSKITAAYEAGCKRFDSAINGFGGCPMAKDDLTGNIATEKLIEFFKINGQITGIDEYKFMESIEMAKKIFPV